MTASRQPLLSNETVVLRAPAQAWSAEDGSVGSAAIHGFYFSDVRIVAAQRLTVGGERLEPIATVPSSADLVEFVSLARQLDDATADPGLRASHVRRATVSGIEESLRLTSRLAHEITTTVRVEFTADATTMDTVKAGIAEVASLPIQQRGDALTWEGDGVSVLVMSDATSIAPGILDWTVTIPAGGSTSIAWTFQARDSLAVVAGVESDVPWSVPTVSSGDERLARWVGAALSDLDALRLTTTAHPESQFLAAGAPWFFTLFGRDSIWAARFMLPLGTEIAADTLRILAGLQGSADVPDTAEEPGKIMHELRRGALEIPGEGIHLPPLYYGTVDATPLWICLLHDAWRWGMPEDEVRALLPHLERALEWMRDSGDADGDGLLEYVDKSGRGLANQGWKDSGDSVQWRDGTLAKGPIALCEVQAYAYEAAIHGADLLESFGSDGAEWRAWAARLQRRFNETFWIDDPAGAYVAIALDADKRPVDTVTSNLGHLLGTGLLNEEQAALVARRLVSPELSSGYGLRTMSTDSAGYWPLSYHGGSVWTHDTAIAIAGLARDGFGAEASVLIDGLLAAASGFDYRMPELHSGDPASAFTRPVPYPAACRPQAWSAASAISVLASSLALNPAGDELGVNPGPAARSLRVDGLRFHGTSGGVETSAAAEVVGSTGIPFVVG